MKELVVVLILEGLALMTGEVLALGTGSNRSSLLHCISSLEAEKGVEMLG